MTMKSKIRFLIIIAIIGMLLISSAIFYSLMKQQEMDETVDKLNQTVNISNDINYLMQQAQVNVIQFTQKKDQVFASEAKAAIFDLETKINEIQELTTATTGSSASTALAVSPKAKLRSSTLPRLGDIAT